MPRPKKETESTKAENPRIKEVKEPNSKTTEIPAEVEKLMQLYPQYEKIWVTPYGSIHPYGVPDYLLKDAQLYENKYYSK